MRAGDWGKRGICAKKMVADIVDYIAMHPKYKQVFVLCTSIHWPIFALTQLFKKIKSG